MLEFLNQGGAYYFLVNKYVEYATICSIEEFITLCLNFFVQKKMENAPLEVTFPSLEVCIDIIQMLNRKFLW